MIDSNLPQRRLSYNLDGDAFVVTRGADGKEWRAPAQKADSDTPGAITTMDGDSYVARRGYEPLGRNQTHSLSYSLDGDPYVVISEGGKVISRTPAEKASARDWDAPGAVRTYDGDVYLPGPAKSIWDGVF